MATIDYSIVLTYIVVAIGIGIYFSRRSSRSIQEYFLSGRNLPWWLLGSSMVATTFAADTPLAITEYVRTEGLWRNWFWWTLAMSHVLAAMVFSRLWRRSGVITDNELIEIRYAGKPAAFLRGFKAAYFATLYNFIVMSWVTSAMSTVLAAFVDIEPHWAVVVCITIALIYSLLGGFWGVVVTDLIQFCVAMVGSVVFAIMAADKVGGMSVLLEKIQTEHADKLDLLPAQDAGVEVWATFLVFVLVMWWANHNADGGGGIIIQRMLSAKNERHALVGTFWFALAHYILRMWPWVVVALVSLVMFPQLGSALPQHKDAYPQVLAQILTPGWRGLFVAVFLAAYMSTVDTHLNWGSSYLVNDIYRRFIKPDRDQRHYVFISRISMVVLAVLSGIIALFVESITDAWEFVWALGAGIGAVLILRWFWWRINAWSEISALASSMGLAIVLFTIDALGYYHFPLYLKAIIVVGGSIVVWVPTTFLTRAEPKQTLAAFVALIDPPGFWPGKKKGKRGLGFSLVLSWLGGIALIYGGLFFVGCLVIEKQQNLLWTGGLIGVGIVMLYFGLRGVFSQPGDRLEQRL